MDRRRKSVFLISLVALVSGVWSPVRAQSPNFEPLDDFSTPRSKIADVDIVTNSPTLQNQSAFQQGQVNSFGSFDSTLPSAQYPTSYQQPANATALNAPNNVASQQAQRQTAAQVQQPIQIDSQTVGRVVGVAGTAILLGAFLKNGGVGGMMNTLGLDTRFHGRASSLSSY
ncbi:MAG: hypothetical protein U0103_00225 [Candidatus Obscuribacterales bacterium]